MRARFLLLVLLMLGVAGPSFAVDANEFAIEGYLYHIETPAYETTRLHLYARGTLRVVTCTGSMAPICSMLQHGSFLRTYGHLETAIVDVTQRRELAMATALSVVSSPPVVPKLGRYSIEGTVVAAPAGYYQESADWHTIFIRTADGRGLRSHPIHCPLARNCGAIAIGTRIGSAGVLEGNGIYVESYADTVTVY